MSLTFLTATNFPQFISKSAKLILILSDDLNNCNFIINQYVQALSKQGSINSIQSNNQLNQSANHNNQIFGIFINQSYKNYSFIQMKCGNNLKSLKERNLFRCLDVLNDLDQFLTNEEDRKGQSNQDKNKLEFNFSKFKTLIFEQLIDFFNLAKDKTDFNLSSLNLNSQNSNIKVLIIDDISTLLSLNVSLKDLMNFLSFLRHFCLVNNVSLIIQSFFDPLNDQPNQLAKLNSYLNSISDLLLTTSKLETGYSNKIDGNLEIKNYTTNSLQSYLFKSTERTTKLNSPGAI